jgi:tellurite resistance protein TerC
MTTPNAVDYLVLVAVLMTSTIMDMHFNRKPGDVSPRQAWTRVLLSVLTAVAFGAYIAIRFGGEAAGQYLAAYPLELSLSLDNVFMFQLLLGGVAVVYRATLLTWAVVLAIAFRAVFLLGGTALLERFAFMELVFGGLLIFTAYKMLKNILAGGEDSIALEGMRTYKVLRWILPFANSWHGLKLVTTKEGGIKLTPAFLIVLCVGFADVIFAVDSVPAVLAVSRDPYVVLAAVMMAVICLKSLYFVYQALVEKFPRVKHVLVIVLFFIGVKLAVGYFGPEVPTLASLTLVLTTLSSGVIWSVLEKRQQ